jgi:hypothetical protein
MFSMNLLFQALLNRIRDAAEATGIEKWRVDYKRNAKGELVVALIVTDERLGPEKVKL